jgi:glycine/D-amino acid oxidase-like deaminating enzyme
MSAPTQPDVAQVVVISGGIIGCSVAYHPVKLGYTDVVVLEQGQLSSGTNWHTAGLATGWSNCGSVSVARTAERMGAS